MSSEFPSARVQSYRDLKVWQKSVALTEEVYRITSMFPRDELYGLSSQLKRAAVSIAANIAEGHARSTRGEYRNHVSIARGSVTEVEVLLLIAERIRVVSSSELTGAREFCDAISRMLTNL